MPDNDLDKYEDELVRRSLQRKRIQMLEEEEKGCKC